MDRVFRARAARGRAAQHHGERSRRLNGLAVTLLRGAGKPRIRRNSVRSGWRDRNVRPIIPEFSRARTGKGRASPTGRRRGGDETSRRPVSCFFHDPRKEAARLLARRVRGRPYDAEALAQVSNRRQTCLHSRDAPRRRGSARRGNLYSPLRNAPRLMVTRETESLALESIAALRALFPSGLAAVRLVGRGEDVTLRTAFEGTEDERDPAQDREASLASKAMAEGVELSSATMETVDHRGRPIGPDEGDAAVVPVATRIEWRADRRGSSPGGAAPARREPSWTRSGSSSLSGDRLGARRAGRGRARERPVPASHGLRLGRGSRTSDGRELQRDYSSRSAHQRFPESARGTAATSPTGCCRVRHGATRRVEVTRSERGEGRFPVLPRRQTRFRRALRSRPSSLRSRRAGAGQSREIRITGRSTPIPTRSPPEAS